MHDWFYLLLKNVSYEVAAPNAARHVHTVDPATGQCPCSTATAFAQHVSQVHHAVGDLHQNERHPLKQKTACAHCGKVPGPADPGLQLCGRCRGARYCSPECQRAAWKGGHKQACQAPANIDG